MNIESPYGGGQSYLPGATGSLLPVKFPAAPVLLADGPQLGYWRVAVVRVLGRSRFGNSRVTCLSCTAILDRRVWGRCYPLRRLLKVFFQWCWLGASLWLVQRTLLAPTAAVGRYPHLTVTLLAQLARMLQGARLAQMFCLCLAAPIIWHFVLGRDTHTFLVLVGWHWSLRFFTVRSDE